MKKLPTKKIFPEQVQKRQPGLEYKMHPRPRNKKPEYLGSGKLLNKVAIITGGDSGIGRAIAILFAREGADIVVVYLNEHLDAKETARLINQEGRECLLISGNVGDEKFCQEVSKRTLKKFKSIDILVNNAAEQHPQKSLLDLTSKQLEKTFRTNIFSYFYMTKSVLKHLKKNSTIINTTSVTAYRGSEHLLDYSATKGAIVSFTRSLALQLAKKKIRVNGVAPGPVWTPLIPSSFSAKKVSTFGSNTPLERAAQPEEIAPCYVFLASDDASYITGQIIHPNGGEIINS